MRFVLMLGALFAAAGVSAADSTMIVSDSAPFIPPPVVETKVRPKSAPKSTRVAVVDMQKLFKGYYKSAEADKSLEAMRLRVNAELEKINEDRLKYRHEFNELKRSADDIMLSAEEREKKHNEAQTMNQRYRDAEVRLAETKERHEKSLADASLELMTKLRKDITNVVQKRALASGYELVLDASGKTFNDMPAVIFASPAIDLTDDVLADLNRGQPKKEPRIQPDNK